MFSCKKEYDESLKNISTDLKNISERASLLGVSLKSLLSDYEFTSVDENFFNQDFGGEIVNDEKVAVSLSAALAGNIGNLGKTYGDLYYDSLDKEKKYSAIELSTSTGAKIELIIFKGEDFTMSFDDDGLLKVYGIIIKMDKNKQFVDHGGFYGRTLNLYADVPTFIYSPTEDGIIHGIANYSKPLELANDDDENAESIKKTVNSNELYPSDAVFVIFNSNENNYIPRQEGNIIDWNYYYGIKEMGYDYEDILVKDLSRNNIKFPEGSVLDSIRDSYKRPLVNYKYINREKCALTTFYAESQNVEVLRLDITGTRSTASFQGLDSFTSSMDYERVDIVFTVIPNEAFSYDIEINASDFMAGLGYRSSKRFVFIQTKTDEELLNRVDYLKKSYILEKLEDDLYEYKDETTDWSFRAFLCGPDFKFVDKVSKL